MKDRTLKITRSGDVEVRIVTDDNTHVVRASIKRFDSLYGDVLVQGNGTAKWNPKDQFVPEIGEQIALGRAFQKFGKNLVSYYDKQAVSPGEYRARKRRAQEVQEVGEVFYRSLHRRTKTHEERIEGAKELTEKTFNLLDRVEDTIDNESFEDKLNRISKPVDTSIAEAQDIEAQQMPLIPSLDEVIEANKKKLGVTKDAPKSAHV